MEPSKTTKVPLLSIHIGNSFDQKFNNKKSFTGFAKIYEEMKNPSHRMLNGQEYHTMSTGRRKNSSHRLRQINKICNPSYIKSEPTPEPRGEKKKYAIDENGVWRQTASRPH